MNQHSLTKHKGYLESNMTFIVLLSGYEPETTKDQSNPHMMKPYQEPLRLPSSL